MSEYLSNAMAHELWKMQYVIPCSRSLAITPSCVIHSKPINYDITQWYTKTGTANQFGFQCC